MNPCKHAAVLVLAVTLAACSSTPTTTSGGTSPPAAAPPPPASAGGSTGASAKAVDAQAVDALKQMGQRLQTLRRFSVELDLTNERVLADGQKLTGSATADLDVAPPTRVAVQTATATTQRALYFNGDKVTLAYPQDKYYSSVDFKGSVSDLIDRLRDNYGIDFPAYDLFAWGTPRAPLDNLQSAMNAGQAVVGGVVCDHYAFRQPGTDWQIWISADGRQLPMMLVVTDLTDEARPQSTTVFHWNLNPTFKDSRFTYVAPKDAKAVDLTPRKRN